MFDNNKMDTIEKLQQAGLTGNESKVYLELVKKGQLTANQIAKNLSLDRTLTYTVLNHLSEKGQVSYIVKEKKKLFSITKTDNLLNSLKSKEILVKELIGDLTKIKKETQENVDVQVLEGNAGIRTLLNLFLKHKGFSSFGSTGLAYFALPEMPAIAKKVEKIKINVRIIGNKKYKGTEAFNFKKFQYRYLNIKSNATTSIFGDYVSIHMIQDMPKPFIILIKNKKIAESYQNHFEVLWKQATV